MTRNRKMLTAGMVVVAALCLAGTALAGVRTHQYKISVPENLRGKKSVEIEIFYKVSGAVNIWEHTLGEVAIKKELVRGMQYPVLHDFMLTSLPGNRRSVIVNISTDYLLRDGTFVLTAYSGHRDDLAISGHVFRK